MGNIVYPDIRDDEEEQEPCRLCHGECAILRGANYIACPRCHGTGEECDADQGTESV